MVPGIHGYFFSSFPVILLCSSREKKKGSFRAAVLTLKGYVVMPGDATNCYTQGGAADTWPREVRVPITVLFIPCRVSYTHRRVLSKCPWCARLRFWMKGVWVGMGVVSAGITLSSLNESHSQSTDGSPCCELLCAWRPLRFLAMSKGSSEGTLILCICI